MDSFTRRQWLKLVSAAGLGALLPGCDRNGTTGEAAPDGSLPRSSEPADVDVAVLGAGLAGLVTAYELKQQGYNAVVLEAQDRVGGRLYTLRDGFEDGQYVELGAVRIPDNHDLTRAYADELGLELVQYPEGNPLYFVDGKRFIRPEPGQWPLDLTDREQELGADYWLRPAVSALSGAGSVEDGTFPTDETRERFDDITFIEHLRALGSSEDYLRLLRADQGTSLSKTGALHILLEVLQHLSWQRTFGVRGGNDQMATRLAQRLGDAIRQRSVIRSLRRDYDGINLTVETDGQRQQLRASRVVCTLPFPALRRIEIDPAFPDDKTRAIEESQLVDAARVSLQTETRFWQDEGIDGLFFARTDTLAERVMDVSLIQEGAQGALMTYSQEDNAARLADIPRARRADQVLSELEPVLPGIRAQARNVDSWIWSEDEWTGGAWSALRPEQWWMASVIPRREGRVHFAGEHTSEFPGWMQGAIASAKRVVQEIEEAQAKR